MFHPREIVLYMSPEVVSHRCAKLLKRKVPACGFELVSKTVGLEPRRLDATPHSAQYWAAKTNKQFEGGAIYVHHRAEVALLSANTGRSKDAKQRLGVV
jgi:hypothetical protein